MTENKNNASPVVGILMGSDSDLSVMKAAAEFLEENGIACEVRVLSAHRLPNKVAEYGTEARKRGMKIIIAGAGGSAHLPGVLAAFTTLPVIGVPILSKLDGLDSLLSIVQMPEGIPVATVAVNGARNAGILAAEILALSDDKVAAALDRFRSGMKKKLEDKDQKLTELGYAAYLEKMGK